MQMLSLKINNRVNTSNNIESFFNYHYLRMFIAPNPTDIQARTSGTRKRLIVSSPLSTVSINHMITQIRSKPYKPPPSEVITQRKVTSLVPQRVMFGLSRQFSGLKAWSCQSPSGFAKSFSSMRICI